MPQPRWSRNRQNSGFRTDAETSGRARAHEKVLQAWRDDGAPAPAGVEMTLEQPRDGRRWNQFEANRQKFGVQSTFDERLYTTEINREHPDFAARERRAIEIAREIEGQAHGGNAHLAEERNTRYDDSGLDEEDKYSGVRQFARDEARAAQEPDYVQQRERAARREDADAEPRAARPFKPKHKFNVSASFTSLQFTPPPQFGGVPMRPAMPVPYGFMPPQQYMVPLPHMRSPPPAAAPPRDVLPLGDAFDYFAQLRGAEPAKPFNTPVNWHGAPSVPVPEPAVSMPTLVPPIPFIPMS